MFRILLLVAMALAITSICKSDTINQNFETKLKLSEDKNVLVRNRNINVIKPYNHVPDNVARDNRIISRSRTANRYTRSKKVPTTAQKLYRSPLGYNCVAYAWSKGFNQYGFRLAKNIQVNSQEPKEGGFVVFNGRKGHIAYIEKVEGSTLTITEGSYQPYRGWIVRRTVTINNQIKGYVL